MDLGDSGEIVIFAISIIGFNYGINFEIGLACGAL